MGFDDVITHLTDFGPYQKRIYFLLCLPGITCAFHRLAGVFLLARPDFRCVLPTELNTNGSSSVTYDSLPTTAWNVSYPFDAATQKWQSCEYLDGGTVMQCDRYVYDKSKYRTSAVTEWNMVCERSILTAVSDSIFMVGVLLGSILFGQLADKYGRKPILTVSLVLQVIFGILAAIAPEYFTYTLSRLIVGTTTSGIMIAYVISMEMVGTSYRLFAGLVCQVFFSFGFMLTAVFAYFIHDWRWLQIALTLPGVIFFSYHWLIPESPRWLLSTGRKSEAIAVIRKAAKVNKVTIPEEVYDNLMDDAKKSDQPAAGTTYSVFDLLKYPNMRRKTLLIFFNWFVNSGTYYGLSWNTNNLGDNVLLNFLISGAVEIPAFIILALTLNRYGRRTILCNSMLAAGIALLLTLFVPNDMNWLLITLAMTGKMAITASYGTVYMFTAEQFPTVVRNIGLGTSSMVARFGSILAPYMSLLGEIWRPMPLIICGALSLTAGLLSLPLPETLNQPLPETLEDGENFGKAQRSTHVFDSGEELNKMLKVKSDEATNVK